MYKINLNYITSRGPWYFESWKADTKKSGGLSTNIGIHFFDMLTWIFGPVVDIKMNYKRSDSESGWLLLENAEVNWNLSINHQDLPKEVIQCGKSTFRLLEIDGESFEFSDGFTELHKVIYQKMLNGKGYGLVEAMPAIEIVEKIRGLL